MARRSLGNKGIMLVKKANQLIESRFKFDIWETRFFLSVLSQIRREDGGFRVYRIWYRDVIKTFGLKSGDSYSFLRAAANSLMEKSFFVNYENEGSTREVRYHILRKIDYLKDPEKGGGAVPPAAESQEYVDVTVEDEMMPLLLQLQKNFTAYDLRNVVKLGVYSMRIYELLKQYESIGERTLEVEEMKKMFEIAAEYPRFPDFNRWVIKPAVRDINKYTDLEVMSMDYLKESKKVKSLRFHFRRKNRDEQADLPAPTTRSAALPGVVFVQDAPPTVEKSVAPAVVISSNLQQFSERLFEWWGVQQEVFLKKAMGKSAAEVESAIEFTKTRIRLGKAENPAGVFLEALAKGHRTAEQQKNQKQQERDRLERDRQAKIQPFLETLASLQEQQKEEINRAIRKITQSDPAVTERVVERLKTSYNKMGVLDFSDKSIEDFRESPMLRAMVKAEIMKDFPEIFSVLNDSFSQKIGAAKAEILRISPEHRFV